MVKTKKKNNLILPVALSPQTAQFPTNWTVSLITTGTLEFTSLEFDDIWWINVILLLLISFVL